MEQTFTAVDERKLGPAWQQAFAEAWPGWRAWYLRKGGERRLSGAEQQLRRHMPELVPVWRCQVELAGGDEVASRFLTFWNPPSYLVHCSQAVLVDRDGPILVRNYDLDPRLSEAKVLRSAWSGRDVVATMEAIAGAADGVNAAGLAVSLAFGGRRVRGEGFGVPLIVRYLLETCERTSDALAALRRIPCHMAYNLTVVDRNGERATVFLSPDRSAEIARRPFATNHQRRVEWDEQARFSCTVERAQALERLLDGRGLTASRLIDAFLAPPLYSSRHGEGFGTVYTAAYRPADASIELRWSGHEPWRLSCDRFAPGSRRVVYGGARHALPPGFTELLAECLRRPQLADWSRLGQFWAGSFPQFAG